MPEFLSVLQVYWCKSNSALFQIVGQAQEKYIMM